MTQEQRMQELTNDFVDELILMMKQSDFYDSLFSQHNLNKDLDSDRETARKYLKQTLN